ncbi:putative nucleotide-sugar transporter YMD8 [Spathaspora sp. JA1]|nr:putative nucleotide-sugar transporter YMD8 [Spathaspora sp. JA1]
MPPPNLELNSVLETGPTTNHRSSSRRNSNSHTVSTNNSGPEGKGKQALFYIAGWYSFSLSISIYNKWMFGPGLGFRFPILITSFHQLCLCILSTITLYFIPELRPKLTGNHTLPHSSYEGHSTSSFYRSMHINFRVYLRQMVPCALTSAGDIGLSNVAVSLLSLSLYTILKSSSLMFVLLFGLLFRLEKFNWRLIVIVIIMTISVTLMTAKPANYDKQPNGVYSTLGITLAITAAMLSGLRWSFTQILLKKNPYTPNSISTIFYVSPCMFVALFLLGLYVEGWDNFTSAPIWEIKGVFGTIGLLIIPGIFAFLMMSCEFMLLKVAHLITLSVAGSFKELLTIGVSSIVFGDRLSFINCIGLTLTFIDVLWYNYYRYMAKVKPQAYSAIKEENIELNKM